MHLLSRCGSCGRNLCPCWTGSVASLLIVFLLEGVVSIDPHTVPTLVASLTSKFLVNEDAKDYYCTDQF
jgi:hypothetical protein